MFSTSLLSTYKQQNDLFELRKDFSDELFILNKLSEQEKVEN